MDIKKQIIDLCKNMGINLVGFTPVKRYEELEEYYKWRKYNFLQNNFEEKDIEKRVDAHRWMDKGKTIVCLAFPYLHHEILNKNIYFSKYTLGKDYHKVARVYMNNIIKLIEDNGGRGKAYVDNCSLPERYLAALSGIGFIGKNNMLITKEYGSYVFLGEIITDLEIQEDTGILNGCKDCSLCIKACPTKCLDERRTNPNRCLSYITQKKDLEEEWLLKLNGRLFGCDTCQDVCPYNKEIKYSNIEDFKPYEFMENVDALDFIYMDKKSFQNKYGEVACSYRGKNVLSRNALINILNMKGNKDIDIQKISSTYLKEYYDRLLRILNL